jgi:hypothetical protein
MRSYGDVVRLLIVLAVLVFPEHLDLLSGANGGIGVDGVLGGASRH